ncbi:uncharacterized protein I303_100289 [Kwoniella dejecticola CBS 10117]|uniref:C2H2-type domain-containing protein n=1 Tax=Kwoniella dejecticola CBS 10117 TaxID=1296121 RepID=A0A1A6AEH0_9TREE|nr:uncharacterized protein I303_00289 [Kwoniella dejecticola CBS 10117]OBR88472.1 hypothetical protein I303_00289 [Kwoniella dejecticola CBS 10117]
MSTSHSRSPPPPPRDYPPPGDRDFDERPGFSRGGFAPIPHRHSDLPPIPPPARYERDEYDRGRRDREFPRRDLDPDPEDRYERREWDDYPPPPRGGGRGSGGSHWEDDYDRPKRRRSPSPLGPSHRQRLHSPSPPPVHHRYGNNLPDPASVETLLVFRQFAEWFRASHPQTAKADEEETRRHRELIESGNASEREAKEKVGMAKRYERYRKEFTSRQLYALFLTHKDSIWFQERYSHLPEFVSFRRRLNRQGRVPLAEKHLEELRSGVWDTVDFDMAEESDAKSTEKSRLNDHDEPEGLDRALGDGGNWTGHETLRAEIAPKPKQVFVKTAPPTTSRKELEELFARIPGFQWLAVSEPAQKKSFHRVAWGQYADDVDIGEVISKLDGQKIDGFTFHMSVNSTPTIGRLRVTPSLSNTMDRLILDGENAKALAIKLEEELMGDDEEEEDKPETEGEASNKTGNAEKRITGLREKVSDSVEETIQRLLETNGLNADNLDDEKKLHKAKIVLDQWLAYLRHGLATCYYCVAPMSFAEELHRKCIGHMRPHPSSIPEVENEAEEVEQAVDQGRGDEVEPSNGVDGVTESKESEAEDGDRDEDRELRETEQPSEANQAQQETNGGGRERRDGQGPGKKQFFPQKTQDEKWAEGLDHKLRPLLGEVDVADYGGRDPEAETKKLCAPLIKQEEASKYRCKDCNKLFRAPEFVIKHIIVKHPEITKAKIDDISTLNNYVLDPQHLQPSLSTPAAVDDKLLSTSLPLPNLSLNFPMAVNPNMPGIGNTNGQFDGSGSGGNMNLMQQQMMMMMQMQQAMLMGMNPQQMQQMNFNPNFPQQLQLQPNSREGAGLASRMGGYASRDSDNSASALGPGPGSGSGPLPTVPPGGEDPRARRGRVSYTDLDEPSAGGGGGLPY